MLVNLAVPVKLFRSLEKIPLHARTGRSGNTAYKGLPFLQMISPPSLRSAPALAIFISEDTVRRGWETVRERYRKKYSDRTKMGTLAFSELAIMPLASDSAVVLGRWKLQRTNDRPHGRFTLVFKHLPEGWRIVYDHTSAAAPPK
jgi:ketosteroid isomerase-like protein